MVLGINENIQFWDFQELDYIKRIATIDNKTSILNLIVSKDE